MIPSSANVTVPVISIVADSPPSLTVMIAVAVVPAVVTAAETVAVSSSELSVLSAE